MPCSLPLMTRLLVAPQVGLGGAAAQPAEEAGVSGTAGAADQRRAASAGDGEGREAAVEEEDEEDEFSSGGSGGGSSSEGPSEDEGEGSPGARAAALAEARLLLRDRPARRRKHGHLVEEEVCGALLLRPVHSHQGCCTGGGMACGRW